MAFERGHDMDSKTNDKINEAIALIDGSDTLEVEFDGIWLKGTDTETDVNGSIWVEKDGSWKTEIWAIDLWSNDYAPRVPSPCAKSGEELAKRLRDAGYTFTEFWDAMEGKPTEA